MHELCKRVVLSGFGGIFLQCVQRRQICFRDRVDGVPNVFGWPVCLWDRVDGVPTVFGWPVCFRVRVDGVPDLRYGTNVVCWCRRVRVLRGW